MNNNATTKKLLSKALDELYDKFRSEGVFEHKASSLETKAMFDKLDNKIDQKFETLSKDLHDEIGKIRAEISQKAPKSWLHWMWGLMSLLMVISTGFNAAQYGEIKQLNETNTQILIEQAVVKSDQETFTARQQRIERTLDNINESLNNFEAVE